MISVKDYAEKYNTSRNTVYRLAMQGKLNSEIRIVEEVKKKNVMFVEDRQQS